MTQTWHLNKMPMHLENLIKREGTYMFPYTRIEQKIIAMLERHIDLIFGVAVTFLAVIVRLSMFPEISGDMAGCLIPWFEDLKGMGGTWSINQYRRL